MNSIQNLLKQILDTSGNIVSELKKEEPDLNKVKEWYDDRSKPIAKLSRIPTQQRDKFSDSEKTETKNLFNRLNLLEKKLNRMLATLSKAKQETLHNLGLHKKAKLMYNGASSSKNSINRQIVDLKPNA